MKRLTGAQKKDARRGLRRSNVQAFFAAVLLDPAQSNGPGDTMSENPAFAYKQPSAMLPPNAISNTPAAKLIWAAAALASA